MKNLGPSAQRPHIVIPTRVTPRHPRMLLAGTYRANLLSLILPITRFI